MVMGFGYTLLSREFGDPGAMLNGVVLGLLGSGFIVINEIWFKRSKMQKLKFSSLVILKSILYSSFFILIIVTIIPISRALEQNISILTYFRSEHFYNFIWKEDLNIMVFYSLALTTIIIFVYQMSRKMGQRVLWNFVTGNYHRARKETRIFMFMDINDSTTIAEKLGDIKYNKLLNDFFIDITQNILDNYGEIYRYVGDEVVVSWKMNKGLQNSRFLRTFFDSKRTIISGSEKYLKEYGLVPSFSAGFHCGDVMVGELGEVKSQICFIGRVMYETSRIEKACRTLNQEVLVSKDLKIEANLDKTYTMANEGSANGDIELYSIKVG